MSKSPEFTCIQLIGRNLLLILAIGAVARINGPIVPLPFDSLELYGNLWRLFSAMLLLVLRDGIKPAKTSNE